MQSNLTRKLKALALGLFQAKELVKQLLTKQNKENIGVNTLLKTICLSLLFLSGTALTSVTYRFEVIRAWLTSYGGE